MSYHSEAGTVEDKARIIKAWVSGRSSPFLVGTSGLGAGLDYPSVRFVIHVDEPYSLMEFAQEFGRVHGGPEVPMETSDTARE